MIKAKEGAVDSACNGNKSLSTTDRTSQKFPALGKVEAQEVSVE